MRNVFGILMARKKIAVFFLSRYFRNVRHTGFERNKFAKLQFPCQYSSLLSFLLLSVAYKDNRLARLTIILHDKNTLPLQV